MGARWVVCGISWVLIAQSVSYSCVLLFTQRLPHPQGVQFMVATTQHGTDFHRNHHGVTASP